jgi:hypothetical protein
MAVLPVIAAVYRCALNWQNPGAGGSAENIIHIHTASTGVSANAVFTCMDAHVTASMWGLVAPSLYVQSVDITPLDGTSATSNHPTGGGAKWTGAGSGDPIPNMASLIKLTTALRGRSHRGRIYLPAVPEGDQANGVLTSSLTATVATGFINWMTAMAADATTPQALVVASYKLAVATTITNLTCEPAAATQRRRQTRLR